MSGNDLENLRDYSFLEILLLEICDRPLTLSDRFKLMRLRLLLALADASARYFNEPEESRSCRTRANKVRELVRAFPSRLLDGHFPEILSQLEICPLCNQLSLVLVHPDLVCDRCWQEQVDLFWQGYRELKQGKSLEEVTNQFNDQLRELTRGTVYDIDSELEN
jgi:hypothetical protein